MKNISAILFLLVTQLLVAHSMAAGQALPSFPDEGIWRYEIPTVSGEVKSVTETLKAVSDSSDTLKTLRIITSHFHRNGTIKRVDFINAKSKKRRGSVYYDSLGRIKKREKSGSDYTVRFTYDDKKGISRKIRPEPDIYGIKDNVIQYDLALLRPLIEKRYRSRDSLVDSTTYRYNAHGNLKTEITYNTSGYGITLDASITGGEEKKDVFPHDTTRFEYQYTDDGEVRVKTEYWTGGPHKQYLYSTSGDTLITTQKKYRKYSDQKWQLKEVTKQSGTTTIEEFYLNDRYFDDIRKIYTHDRLTALVRFKDGAVTERIEHTYKITRDASGHWTSIRHFKEGQLTDVKTREIAYWK